MLGSHRILTSNLRTGSKGRGTHVFLCAGVRFLIGDLWLKASSHCEAPATRSTGWKMVSHSSCRPSLPGGPDSYTDPFPNPRTPSVDTGSKDTCRSAPWIRAASRRQVSTRPPFVLAIPSMQIPEEFQPGNLSSDLFATAWAIRTCGDEVVTGTLGKEKFRSKYNKMIDNVL